MGQRAGGVRLRRLLVSDPTASGVSKVAAAGRPFTGKSSAGAKTQTNALNQADRWVPEATHAGAGSNVVSRQAAVCGSSLPLQEI